MQKYNSRILHSFEIKSAYSNIDSCTTKKVNILDQNLIFLEKISPSKVIIQNKYHFSTKACTLDHHL